MTGYFPAFDAEWQAVSPAEAGFDAERVNEVRRYAQANESRMDRATGKALAAGHFSEPMPDSAIIGPTRSRGDPSGMILNGGRIVAEWGPTMAPDMTFSVTNSFLALCAGIAFDDGLIPDPDRPVRELVDDGNFDSARNRGITWTHLLLQQTSDIFHTAQALRAIGFDVLPMPGNYYDDLQGRFGLPAAELEQKKQANLLYDEDTAGRYYQLYSKPYGGGFFFGIVQREAVYGGYGAANAPFRIAALKRLLKPQEASPQ